MYTDVLGGMHVQPAMNSDLRGAFLKPCVCLFVYLRS